MALITKKQAEAAAAKKREQDLDDIKSTIKRLEDLVGNHSRVLTNHNVKFDCVAEAVGKVSSQVSQVKDKVETEAKTKTKTEINTEIKDYIEVDRKPWQRPYAVRTLSPIFSPPSPPYIAPPTTPVGYSGTCPVGGGWGPVNSFSLLPSPKHDAYDGDEDPPKPKLAGEQAHSWCDADDFEPDRRALGSAHESGSDDSFERGRMVRRQQAPGHRVVNPYTGSPRALRSRFLLEDPSLAYDGDDETRFSSNSSSFK